MFLNSSSPQLNLLFLFKVDRKRKLFSQLHFWPFPPSHFGLSHIYVVEVKYQKPIGMEPIFFAQLISWQKKAVEDQE